MIYIYIHTYMYIFTFFTRKKVLKKVLECWGRISQERVVRERTDSDRRRSSSRITKKYSTKDRW